MFECKVLLELLKAWKAQLDLLDILLLKSYSTTGAAWLVSLSPILDYLFQAVIAANMRALCKARKIGQKYKKNSRSCPDKDELGDDLHHRTVDCKFGTRWTQ